MRACLHPALGGVALLLGLVCLPRVAPALVVYHSAAGDGVPSTPAQINNRTTLVPVYFDNGAAVGASPCTASGGDEICQWAVEFDTTGDLAIVDIDWNASTVEDDEPTAPAVVRKGTGGNASAGQRGPTLLATVSVVGTKGDLRLFTPAGFGFVDKNGGVLTVDPLGAVVAEAASLPFRQVVAQEDHLCGVLGNGELKCWGAAFSGAPTPPAGSFKQVAVSNDGACAIATDGSVSCWGPVGGAPSGSFYYEIAAGDDHFCGLQENLEVDCWGTFAGAIDPGPFTAITRGYDHVCTLDLESGVRCFGDDTFGQSSPPVGETFVDLAAGEAHSCGIRGDGSLECWGSNSAGQRDGHPTSGIWTEVAISEEYSCAVENDGEVTCWGSSGSVATPPAGPFRQLTAAADWACGVRTDGSAECWDADTSDGVPVASIPAVPAVAFPQIAASGKHSCDIGIDEAVDCWGSGSGTVSPPAGALTHLDLGLANGCAVEVGGTVECWGDDTGAKSTPGATVYSQVSVSHLNGCGVEPDGGAGCWGTNTSNGIDSPPADSFLQIDGGGGHYCGVVSTGTGVVATNVECWGDDSAGQSTPPPGDFVQVSSGTNHTCGLERSGAVQCWGSNSDGQTAAPSGVFVEVTAGRTHSCARRADGTVTCWGRNTDGESSPPAGTRFAAIAGGGSSIASAQAHSCGVTKRGAIVCWGGDADSAPTEPPLDSDLDSREDAADNCALAPNGQFAGTCVYPTEASGLDPSTGAIGAACTSSATCTLFGGGVCSLSQADGDADGVGDACDNSLTLANGRQFNRDIDLVGDPDPDAWGDVFDNCPEVFQSDQADTDLDGIGDACAPAFIQITEVGGGALTGFTLLQEGDEYEISLRCPTTPINKVELGVYLPEGITGDVGPGCSTTPGASAGCTTATGTIGSTVDAQNSFQILQGTAGAPGDTLFIHFEGNLTDGALCTPLQKVTLSNMEVGAFPTEESRPNFTADNLASVTGLDGDAFTNTDSEVLEFAEYAFLAGPTSAFVNVQLAPAPGDVSGTQWQVLLDSAEELYQLTLGVHVDGAVFGDIEFRDCPANQLVPTSNCAGSSTVLGGYVNGAASFTVGPDSAHGTNLENIMWFNLQGSAPVTGFGLPALNYGGIPIALGIIQINNGVLAPGVPPTLTVDGVASFAASGNPFVRVDGGAVALADYNLTADGQGPNDPDQDNNPSATDNCDFAHNPDQADGGGLLTDNPNATGDVCECGEASEDGRLDPPDVVALQIAMASGSTDNLESTEEAARCSVSGGVECDIGDLVVLKLATEEAPGSPPLLPTCLRQQSVSGPPN